MGKFEVMAECCHECLYGKNKIVSDKRRAEILKQIERDDTYFICHKATIAGRECACRGDWNARGAGKLGRFAKWCGAFVFVGESELEPSHD